MNDLPAASSRYLELLKGTLTDTVFALRHYFRCSWRKPGEGGQ
jgi:hypothetical protein